MQVQSGSSVSKRTRISHVGSSQLRRIVSMPGLVGVPHNPVLQAFHQRLLAHGRSKKAALLACVPKRLRIMDRALIHRRPFIHDHARA